MYVFVFSEKHRASKVMEAPATEPGADGSAQSRTNVSNNTSDNTTPTSDQNVPSSEKTAEGVTNMAFTVDFGDEATNKLEGKSLSSFMPSKIRKSFRERQEKSHDKPTPVSSKSSSKVLTQPAKLGTKEKTTPESVKASPKDKVVLESRGSFREKVTPEKAQAVSQWSLPCLSLLLYTAYGKHHLKRDLWTYAKSADPDQLLRL